MVQNYSTSENDCRILVFKLYSVLLDLNFPTLFLFDSFQRKSYEVCEEEGQKRGPNVHSL
jgi:hypothetical protein